MICLFTRAEVSHKCSILNIPTCDRNLWKPISANVMRKENFYNITKRKLFSKTMLYLTVLTENTENVFTVL